MSPVISLDTRTVPGPVTGRAAHGKASLDWADIAPGSAHTLPEGMRLEDYEIVGPIGEGGFGIVYLAWDHALEQHVAIKEYLPAVLASRANVSPAVVVKSQRHKDDFCLGMRSFLNEARILARFDHPSLVRVLHFWEGNGTAYMAMPYYEGPTLARALGELGRPPDEAELCGWLHPLLDALGTMHAASCFHRDIAPDNILLTDHGPVLLDFGAARRVIEGVGPSPTVVFKPGFAPIEQYGEVASMKQGAWTDLYALASVVYAAVTGQPPTPSIERLMDDQLKPLSQVAHGRYSEPFLAAIDAALSLHPRNRPQSAAEFWTLLSCGQQLQELDLVRAVRGIDAPTGTATTPLAPEMAPEPTMPLDEDLDSFFEAPPKPLPPERTVAPEAEFEPEREPGPGPVVEEASPLDPPEAEDTFSVSLPPLEHSIPQDRRPPVSNWPPLRIAPSPVQHKSNRIKVAALLVMMGCVGLAVLGYHQFGGRVEPEPAAHIALPTPPAAAPAPAQALAPEQVQTPAPVPPPATEAMSATEALSLPEPVRAPVVAAPQTPVQAPEPVVVLPAPSVPEPEVTSAAPTLSTPVETNAPEARPPASRPITTEPARKAVARAPSEAARPARREARATVAEQPIVPAVVQAVPPEIPQIPQMHTRCTDILQRASLGPVSAEETAILRKGCE